MLSINLSPVNLTHISAGSRVITPLLYMPLISDLSVVNGIGTPTFTRAKPGTYIDRVDGRLKIAAINVPRFQAGGYLSEGIRTNLALHARDMSNAAYVKTNITAVKDATGLDGITNSATTLTATSTNGTVFQTFVIASQENTYSVDVRRKTGSGTIEITDDGGSTFTDITSELSSSYSRFSITTTQANPSIGFRITASGDEIEVDFNQLQNHPIPTSRIETEGTPESTAADSLLIQSSGNYPSHSLGTVAMRIDRVTPVDFVKDRHIFRLNSASANILRLTKGTGDTEAFVEGATRKLDDNGLPNPANLALVFDGSFFRIYNGAGITTDKSYTPLANSETTIFIGRSSSGLNDNLDGHIKHFQTYDVDLNASQVAQLPRPREFI